MNSFAHCVAVPATQPMCALSIVSRDAVSISIIAISIIAIRTQGVEAT
ncbi:MAG TPA: hypothetical protein PKZ53_06785 [Acidobacteriota bacterium]|nr:hypothetical protein [Acidobacteriota bacterium]